MPMDTKKKTQYAKTCNHCKITFITHKANKKNCSVACYKMRSRPSYEEKIRKANERWLADKPKASKKGFGQLNEEAEWKRVWDDNSWQTHYNHVRG